MDPARIFTESLTPTPGIREQPGSFATEAIRQQIPGMSGYDPKAEVKSG
jgi:hypothetical protein